MAAGFGKYGSTSDNEITAFDFILFLKHNASSGGVFVMENVKAILIEHWDNIMAWYNSLTEVHQYGVLFIVILAVLFIGIFILLSKITR